MCQFALSRPAIESAYGIDFSSHFRWELEALGDFEQMGLVSITANQLAVTTKGRFFVRAIAGTFDRYLQTAKSRATYSKLI